MASGHDSIQRLEFPFPISQLCFLRVSSILKQAFQSWWQDGGSSLRFALSSGLGLQVNPPSLERAEVESALPKAHGLRVREDIDAEKEKR